MFSCSLQQRAAVQELVGHADSTTQICSEMDVARLGAQGAVIRYLAQQQLHSGVAEADNSLDVMFVMFSGYLVFVMQAGFAMLCAGHIRVKNNMNILLKNVLDCSMGTLAWFLIGNGFAFGEQNGAANPFIGAGDFALSNTNSTTTGYSSYHSFFFHWAFSATATTIMAGAVAERINFLTYLMYTCMMNGFLYPVVAHWFWTKSGWLSPLYATPLFGSGAIDFAGGAVVHAVGGMASLLGVYFCGPRIGRFNINGEPNRDYRETNSNLVVLGTFLLWFGWYGFNPGSAAAVATYKSAALVSRTAVATTLAAGCGGVWLLLLTFIIFRRWDVMQLCNGVLCGLVTVTPGCGVIDVWAGLIVAVLGSSLFLAIDQIMLKRQLDDVVAATPMHLGCGGLGMLLVGLFARAEYVEEVYGPAINGARRWGIFFGGDGRLLAAQVIGVLVTMAWVSLFLVPFFWVMRRIGIIRVPLEHELAGLDASRYAIITTNEMPQMPAPRQKVHV